MIKCSVLGKEFSTKDEMFKALKANKKEILALKTATIKCSEGILMKPELIDKLIENGNEEIKASFTKQSGHIYPVINTTNFMDSHKDVHFDGIWDKSKGEQKGKVYYALNHKLEIGQIIAYPKDVEIFTHQFTFKELGHDYEGSTQALIYKVKLQDYANKDALAVIDNKLPAQNSVRMQYVKVQMGINSTEKGYEQEKSYYDSRIENIANKDQVAEDGYFFGVTEAKISKEGSLVLLGSNSVTPILYASEPEKSTHETDDTESKEEIENKQSMDALNEFYNSINF
jgi:hypothetical protein